MVTDVPPVPGAVTVLRCTLTAAEPGGVTVPAPLRRGEVDAVIDTDHAGRVHIPPTSLAGALRAEMHRRTGNSDDLLRFFGDLLPDSGGDNVDAVASRLWILRATNTSASVATQVDRRTAIDRRRGAAARSTLRADETLLPGAAFEVFMRWDGAPDSDFHILLDTISTWEPLLGRGVSRGRGRHTVSNLRYGTLDLTSPHDLLTWLTSGGPDLIDRVARTTVPCPGADPARVLTHIRCDLAGPLHIGAGEDDTGPDETTTARVVRRGGRYLVPASTLKGVLRSRIEYILRSVGKGSVCERQDCGVCFTCSVFGHGAGHSTEPGVGRRGRIRFLDAPIQPAVTGHRRHIATDRFTGGAAARKLYTRQVVETGAFGLIVEDIGLTDTAQRRAVRALLRLALQDLRDEHIGIGGSTTRGYGSVHPHWQGSDLPTLDQARADLAALPDDGTAPDDIPGDGAA